jgi:hypothetical protein
MDISGRTIDRFLGNGTLLLLSILGKNLGLHLNGRLNSATRSVDAHPGGEHAQHPGVRPSDLKGQSNHPRVTLVAEAPTVTG